VGCTVTEGTRDAPGCGSMVAEWTDVPPPPPLMVVEGPGLVAPMVAISPDSVLGTAGRGVKGGVEYGSSGNPGAPNSPGMQPAAAPVPPPLRRQNASRFSWPPDSQQEWCYIGLSPTELAAQCERVLGRPTAAREVAELFTSPAAAESRAYAVYRERYHDEIDQILNGMSE
jgi:hypothetical protein